MISFSFLLMQILATNCSCVHSWQYSCEDPHFENYSWVIYNCVERNGWKQYCQVYDEVECQGERSFYRLQWCPNRKGKSYAIALTLSYFFGVFGFDRFYLGYVSLGFLKFITCGFFFIGYLLDCVLITLQIIVPSNTFYACHPTFPFLRQKIHPDIL